jgi:5'(3')-deoxyribonucleotidase
MMAERQPTRRIGIDMDGVIADALPKHLALYNAEFHARLTLDDLHGQHLGDVVHADHRARLEEYLAAEDFFADLPVIADSVDVIRELRARYEVFITSAAMDVPASFAAKFAWLGRHFPFIPSSHIVFCGDKSVIAADYLIDDEPRHFARFGGEGILFTAPQNRLVTGYRRVDSWADVRRLFLAAAHDLPDQRVR